MNGSPPAGVVYCNLKSSAQELPSHEDIPNIAGDSVMRSLMKGDENAEPYFKVEAIDFPVNGTGGIYTKSFFKSFLDRMGSHPFGGNKLGHSYPEKNDFYTVGGLIEEGKEGSESGTVYFKIYVPSMGYETSNFGFIRDLSAGNVHFSLVTLPEYELRKDSGTGEMVRHFTASVGMERNDAVPFEGGAMPQQVNGRNKYEEARKLILAGKVNYTDKIQGDGFTDGGIVYRSGLRRIASLANADDGVKELLSLIDKQRNGRESKGVKGMDKEDAIKALKGLYMNGLTSMTEIADGIGSTAPSQVRNETDKKNAEIVKEFREKLGGNPLAELDMLLNTKGESDRIIVEYTVRNEVGMPALINGNGEGVANPCYTYAMQKCLGKSGKELKNAIEGLKTDSIMQQLRAQQADITSGFNRMVPGGSIESKGFAVSAIKEYS